MRQHVKKADAGHKEHNTAPRRGACCATRQDIEHRGRLVPPEAIWKQVEAWTSGTICTAMTSNRLYPDHRSSKCRTSGL